MAPRDLHPEVVQRRLVSMRELLDDLDALGPVTLAQLSEDRFRRHVVHQLLTQLVQHAIAVNSHVVAALGSRSVPDGRASFELAGELGLLPEPLVVVLRPSVGLRNVLVHAYTDVDEQVVVDAVPLALRDYAAYVHTVASWLERR